MMIRGWSRRAAPFSDRKVLDSAECVQVWPSVVTLLDEKHRSLIDRTQHDNIRNFEIVLHKRAGSSNADWWDLNRVLNAALLPSQ